MSSQRSADETRALAGMFQATALVKQLARTGEVDEHAFAASLGSLFRIDAESVDAVYGGLGGLRLGLAVVTRQLGAAHERDTEITAYVARIMHLERQLAREAGAFTAIRGGIADLATQAQEVGATHPAVVATLASLYVANVSSITPRIMVGGDPVCLNRSGNPERIRALLLAAVRAAVLWRQVGGRRLRLIFGRARLLAAAQQLLPLAEAGSGE